MTDPDHSQRRSHRRRHRKTDSAGRKLEHEQPAPHAWFLDDLLALAAETADTTGDAHGVAWDLATGRPVPWP